LIVYKYKMNRPGSGFTISILNENTFLILEHLSYQNQEQTLLFFKINTYSLMHCNHLCKTLHKCRTESSKIPMSNENMGRKRTNK
jgi:hypothetical protein